MPRLSCWSSGVSGVCEERGGGRGGVYTKASLMETTKTWPEEEMEGWLM